MISFYTNFVLHFIVTCYITLHHLGYYVLHLYLCLLY